ncbi:two-component system, NtrC family, C4-dicarboxylate transport response regulator DctD [Epibacterium ulvae]|uniref:Two-component system, NtrC family, C4-dicarboxylate transport response regulator DctD n=1 Tax=Epibacterium ulvae TaxID=1156985 RepID=A0A1G5R6B0_9RHOB|nr:sigma-54 dependent transcriptional regulator [Epibacterium ulvae]SCZ68849.1 two-component system, NtrC family, C4-dicarboxylate transport response regulator DctD [Epibacterium ulvae]
MTDTTKFSVLVVEDDKSMRLSLMELLEAANWHVDTVARAELALDRLTKAQPDVILSDIRMPGMSGIDLLHQLQGTGAPPIVLISAHGDIPTAVQAMQDGAYSYLEKPYDPRRLLSVLSHAAEQHRMQHQNQRLKERLTQLAGLDRTLLGQSKQIMRLRDDILDLAQVQTSVLIQGETGTGKELVARALHDLGPNSDGPFVAVNCAVLSAERFEQEMFGTVDDPSGYILSAIGGTVFLDEICACPLPAQAKLLRVLEDKQVLPVGADTPIAANFRVISATNQDIIVATSAGQFRADLLYRINTMALTLPPLRGRRDDLMLLCIEFMQQLAQVYEIAPPVLTPDDLTQLMMHEWPGNVRELRNVIERRILAARRGGGSMEQALQADPLPQDVPETLREAVASFERELISKAIRTHQGRMDAAAEALGIGRRTLNEKIVKLGLNKDALL